MLLAFEQTVIDTKEQFALPLAETLVLAKELDVKHPVYPGTKVPIVQTIDFICDINTSKKGIAVKQHATTWVIWGVFVRVSVSIFGHWLIGYQLIMKVIEIGMLMVLVFKGTMCALLRFLQWVRVIITTIMHSPVRQT